MGDDESSLSSEPLSIKQTPTIIIKHEVVVPAASHKSSLRSIKYLSPAKPIGWREKSNVSSDYDPLAGEKPRKRRSKKNIDSDSSIPVDTEQQFVSSQSTTVEMADKDDKYTETLPGSWQKTPNHPEQAVAEPSAEPSTHSNEPISSPNATHVPKVDLHRFDVHVMTDVTAAIKTIRQLRAKVVFEQRGINLHDERHKELEDKLASLESEE